MRWLYHRTVIGLIVAIILSLPLLSKTFVVSEMNDNITTTKIEATEQLIEIVAKHTKLWQPDGTLLPFVTNLLSNYIVFDTPIKRKVDNTYQWYINAYIGNTQIYRLVKDALKQMQQVHIYTDPLLVKKWLKRINILIRITDMMLIEEEVQSISSEFIDSLREQRERFEQLLREGSAQLDIIILPPMNEDHNDTLYLNEQTMALEYGQFLPYMNRSYEEGEREQKPQASYFSLLLDGNSSYMIAVNKKDFAPLYHPIWLSAKEHQWVILKPSAICINRYDEMATLSTDNNESNRSISYTADDNSSIFLGL